MFTRSRLDEMVEVKQSVKSWSEDENDSFFDNVILELTGSISKKFWKQSTVTSSDFCHVNVCLLWCEKFNLRICPFNVRKDSSHANFFW